MTTRHDSEMEDLIEAMETRDGHNTLSKSGDLNVVIYVAIGREVVPILVSTSYGFRQDKSGYLRFGVMIRDIVPLRGDQRTHQYVFDLFRVLADEFDRVIYRTTYDTFTRNTYPDCIDKNSDDMHYSFWFFFQSALVPLIIKPICSISFSV